MLNRLSLYCIL